MQNELLTYEDLDEIRGLQPDDWPDIVPSFEFYLRYAFCKPVKTIVDGRIAGIGSLITFDHTGWIGHMIVHKNFRRRGIAYQLMLRFLEDLKENAIETGLLVASEMGRPVYLKAGFRDVTKYFFMKREEPWKERVISKNIIPFEEKHRPAIYALDKKVSGENREKVLTDFLKDSQVYLKNNQVQGYFIPGLKEGLIIADTEEAGLALLEVKCANAEKVTLPRENTEAIRFLEQNGFVKSPRIGTRMIFGKEHHWIPEKVYSRIGGNLG